MQKPAWARDARTGPVRRHKQLVFFACEGLIALYDERAPDEDYSVHTPDDFEARAKGMMGFAKQCKAADAKWLREEAALITRGAQDMLDSAAEARYMGDPSDPKVQAFWARHRQRARSQGVSWDGPQLQEVPVGRFTGRDARPDADQAALSQMAQSAKKIYTPPVKKARGTKLLLND